MDYVVCSKQEPQPRIDAAVAGCFTRGEFATAARLAPTVVTFDNTMGNQLTVTDSTQARPRLFPAALRIKTLMVGFYGMRNLGDELMLHCLRQWLKPQGAELTILAENPTENQRLLRLPRH